VVKVKASVILFLLCEKMRVIVLSMNVLLMWFVVELRNVLKIVSLLVECVRVLLRMLRIDLIMNKVVLS